MVVSDEKRVLEINDNDFTAWFNGKHWTVTWKWKEGIEPQLHSTVGCYQIKAEDEDAFHKELESWIEEGWLQEAKGYVGPVVPLMAVAQINKGKVRPVLDYRKLNDCIVNHSGGSSVCDETVRSWRKKGERASMLDLRRAYLQVHVHESQWRHQVVRVKGKHFFLTRLGFGLCSAPKIMKSIVERVLSLDDTIKNATASYVDDIHVDESMVSAGAVAKHLLKYGLETRGNFNSASFRIANEPRKGRAPVEARKCAPKCSGKNDTTASIFGIR